MRELLHRLAVGVAMSAGTVAVCSVSSDTGPMNPKGGASTGLAMCTVAPPPAVVDVTSPPNAGGRGAHAKPEPRSLRRLRMAEDEGPPRRDYFDDERDLRDERDSRDEDRFDTPRSRRDAHAWRSSSRGRHEDRPRSARAVDVESLSSGLEGRHPKPHDRRVLRFVRYFTETRDGRRAFASALERSGLYEEIITSALREQNLPKALIAAALVESGFTTTAVSSTGAVGLWQFMAATARAYGLRVDRNIDERRNPWLSSRAAAEHLADLYEQLESWELALAAYNLGYKGVTSRLDEHKVNDFWELADRDGALPAETAQYVPRVLAAAIILSNTDAFDFDDVRRAAPLEASEVEAAPGMSLTTIARAAELPVRQLRELNLELLTPYLPDDTRDPFTLHVPPRVASRVRAAVAELERSDRRGRDDERGGLADPIRGPRWRTVHRERERDAWGDPLYADDGDRRLARRTAERDELDTPSFDDAEDRASRKRPRILNIDRRRAAAKSSEDAASAPPSRSARKTSEVVFYRTIEGDTAESIGRTFGLSADDVCTQNGFKPGSPIERGALLRLRVTVSALRKLEPPTTEG
jgi:membrane-bound lytic murein transglycosylase D